MYWTTIDQLTAIRVLPDNLIMVLDRHGYNKSVRLVRGPRLTSLLRRTNVKTSMELLDDLLNRGYQVRFTNNHGPDLSVYRSRQ